VPSLLQPPEPFEYKISCPSCRTKYLIQFSSGLTYWKCPNCGARAKYLYATVRAKRGRSSRGGRDYSIRYVEEKGEGLINFLSTSNSSDIELRSRDRMIIFFKQNMGKKLLKKGIVKYRKKPSRIYNLTIDKIFYV